MNPGERILSSIKEFGMSVGSLPNLKEQGRRGKSLKAYGDASAGRGGRADGLPAEPYGFTKKTKKVGKQKRREYSTS